MKARLNITIEEDILENVKAYAEEKNITLSGLVESYFKTLTKKKKGESLLDVIDSLPEPKTHFAENFDFKEEYYKERAKKYGF